MGGCASKPKDLDLLAKSTAEGPATEKAQAETAPQENNGGETPKPEEAVENPSESKEEDAKESSEPKPAEEPKEESKAEEKDDAKVKDEEKKEANVAVSPEPVKAPEPVKEQAKPTEAQTSDDKSDEPLVTI